ncbi:hypothetical protein [Amycolatopsis sp. SID8362]|uniref:hypothetical protein n=1 Tax=Amycolatopsis sp. SID8362 TaxID=2690346 RepID=UPI00136DCC81|nr:hypothetical protein [Amycolatopsis sp. SID8362]NBH08370.1 hypothetical protein [Amycolatopsis sp. SID8362]NED45064.1 hypothetical protein [Amycolatopsis sp. SID8362]
MTSPEVTGDAPGLLRGAVAAVSLAVMLGSLLAAMIIGGTLKDRSGSLVATASVERVVDRTTAVARVDEPGGPRYRDVRVGRNYPRGARLEVRYWPHDEEPAAETRGELRIPGLWIFGVCAVGFVAGNVGLRLAIRRSRPSSA